MKIDASGLNKAFGGINVLLVGDFWQLDPPKGGFLGAIPVEFISRGRKFSPKPDVSHGQSILWGHGPGSVQGVTELTECVRTEGDWLLEVQQQMRDGSRSENNWHFYMDVLRQCQEVGLATHALVEMQAVLDSSEIRSF